MSSGELAAAPAEAEPLVPREGLSLAALRAFAEKHASEEYTVQPASVGAPPAKLPFKRLTTAQVVEAIVKPATEHGAAGGAACTYAELLLAQGKRDARGRPHVGPATRFVSHAWSYPFVDLLDALYEHAAEAPDEEDAYLWIDIFVGSQHKAAALDTRWFKTAFAKAVTLIGHTLLVLQPWHDPKPLHRSWCLWEIHSTLKGGAELQIVLSSAQRKAFQDALAPERSRVLTRGASPLINRLMAPQIEGFDDIQAAMSKIDVRTASAFNAADKHMIEAAVRDSAGGFEAVNGRIHDRMREWLAQVARDLVAHRRGKLGDTHPETLKAMEKLAMLLNIQGKLREAEPLYRDVLRCRRETLGDTHPNTLGTMNNLGVLLKDEGKLGEAELLHREALNFQRAKLGNNHPDTLTCMGNLASLLEKKGEHSEAALLVQHTLSCQRAMLGDTHPETLASMNNLAILLNTQGKLSDAEPLLCSVLRVRRATLGNSHPLTLSSMVNLAALLRDQGKLSEAEPLFRDALRCHRETLGDTHPDTLTSMSNLGVVRQGQGKLSEAAPLFRDALRCQRDLLGSTHPDTLTSMDNLAVLLNELGELSDAEALCREARRVRCETLGDSHPDTLMSVNNLAWILHAIPGSTAEAVSLAREAVRGFEAECNAMHAAADKLMNALDTLAAALEADGQTKEAAAVRARILSSGC